MKREVDKEDDEGVRRRITTKDYDEGDKGEDGLEYGPMYIASMTCRVDREKPILETELEEPHSEEGGGGRRE